MTIVCDVAIVGAGPVGATAANLLGLRRIETVIVERETVVHDVPRAVHFDDEVMRTWQYLGLLPEIAPATSPLDGVQFVNAARRVLLEFETQTSGLGHPSANMFYQPHLESVLRAGLLRFECVQLYLGHEVEEIEPENTGVRLLLRARESSRRVEIRARYLLGCDGGRSFTRRRCGVALEDLGFDQQWLVVDAEAHRPESLSRMLQQICDPARPTTYVPVTGGRFRWEFMLLPNERPEQLEDPERVKALLRPWTGHQGTRLLRHVVYTYHALMATRWQVGRVFLLGDAAHQMPPFLGQGMCSGIRDAMNLCWKLDLCLAGKLDPKVLESYQMERRPHVARLLRIGVWAGRVIQTRNPFLARLRDSAFALASVAPAAFLRWKLGVAAIPGLGAGPLVSRSPGAGEQFIQPRVQTADGRLVLLDEVLGAGFALVGFGIDPRQSLSPEALLFWRGLGATFLEIIAPGRAESPTEGSVTVTDCEERLGPWFARRTCEVAVVRPDRYVFGTFHARDVEVATERLRTAIGYSAAGPVSKSRSQWSAPPL